MEIIRENVKEKKRKNLKVNLCKNLNLKETDEIVGYSNFVGVFVYLLNFRPRTWHKFAQNKIKNLGKKEV